MVRNSSSQLTAYLKRAFVSVLLYFPGVTISHLVAQEETFWLVPNIPDLCILDEAVEKVDNTICGFSIGVWTEKGSRILKMSTELKVGVVWANTIYNRLDSVLPFGGYKESGFPREGLFDCCQLV